MEDKKATVQCPLHEIAIDGDLTIVLTKSEAIKPLPEGALEYKQIPVARYKVDRSTLINLPTEDNRHDNYFKLTLTGNFKEARQTAVEIEDQDADALRVFFLVVHGKPDSAYTEHHSVMWPLASFLDYVNVTSKIFEAWFAAWYGFKDEKINSISPQEMLFPCHRFNHAPGFLKATKECVYQVPGYIHEKNPTDFRAIHLHPLIIQQLNAARGRLRTILHRESWKPINRLLKFSCSCSDVALPSGAIPACTCKFKNISPCTCRADTVSGYERALQRTQAYPLEETWHKNCADDILSRLKDFGYTVPSGACGNCTQNYTREIAHAISGVRTYFDGLCLDCMNASKRKTSRDEKLDENDVYWIHNQTRQWDEDCRVTHGQPTWYYSYMVATVTSIVNSTTILTATITTTTQSTAVWNLDPLAAITSSDTRWDPYHAPETLVVEIRPTGTESTLTLLVSGADGKPPVITRRSELSTEAHNTSTAIAKTTATPTLTATNHSAISTPTELDGAVAAQPIQKRWELPTGPFSVNVPTDSYPIEVCSSDCSQHCTPFVTESHECLRFAKDIPRWGSMGSEQRGPFYESYACLVCLNLPALMTTPDHPEGGNSLRETQDLINAIWSVSKSVGIPPQLPFAMAMQESQASVRPHSGDQGNSRGTFQVQIPGSVTCLGTPIDECKAEQILAMVSLGICGQWSCAPPYQSPGIVTYWQRYPTDVGLIARGYNSGSVYDQNDLTVVAVGTNSYSSDISNRMMGRVVGGFYSRTCCAKCDQGRNVLEVHTCGPVDGLMSDFCGDDRYSFHGQIG
ncbi:hypothetical protein FKW77_007093 [Venturia effusa]|uniref:Uncharacterized protein n=1 Tax=Venturia effusa TaxID=50376 RepID=A0A517LHH6_9PEZI|nr:hypothetical protein FKW77_007093 [Venturia effusa]